MEDRPASNTLAYAAPRILLEGKYHHRTTAVIVGSILTFGVGLTVLIFASRGSASGNLTVLFAWSIPLLMWVVSGVGIYLWLCGQDKRIRITDDGIEDGNHFWPWQRINSIGATFYDDLRVIIWFAADQPMLGVIGRSKSLPITPNITVTQFEKLCEDLRREITPMHPHLTVEERIYAAG